MILTLNIILAALVLVAVVLPLARAIQTSRTAKPPARRRQPAWTSTRAPSRMRTHALGGSDR